MSSRILGCSCRRGPALAVVHPRPNRASSCGGARVEWGPSIADLRNRGTSNLSRTVAACAWGDDIVFSPASVVSTKKEAKDLTLVTVNVGTEISKGYTKGGQFLQMKVGDSKPAFLAIANAPAASEMGLMEFLIKDVPETTANLIVNLKEGDEVSVSPVMGKGFPVEKVPPEDFNRILIFATGSGISPIKALIDSGSLDPTERDEVTLFYGATNTDSMAFLSRIPQWELLGVNVVPVFSERKEGYVQDIYKLTEAPEEPEKTCVLVCGQKDMAEAVYEAVEGQGVSRENCLTNF